MTDSARGRLRLCLAAGAAVFIVALSFFAAVASQVLSNGPLALLDARLVERMHAGGTPVLAQLTLAFTNIHGTAGVLVLSALLALYLASRRDWLWVWALVVCVPGAMLLNVAVKNIFQRARPHFDNPLLTLETFSFPSGHVAAATALYGFVAVLWIAHTQGRIRRLAVVPLALLMIVLVALSRMVLGVHYLSDVLAAFAQSCAWLAVWLSAAAGWAMRSRA